MADRWRYPLTSAEQSLLERRSKPTTPPPIATPPIDAPTVPNAAGLPVWESPFAPTHREIDGRREPVLCTLVFGGLLVHPSRTELLVKAIDAVVARASGRPVDLTELASLVTRCRLEAG